MRLTGLTEADLDIISGGVIYADDRWCIEKMFNGDYVIYMRGGGGVVGYIHDGHFIS